MKKKKVSWRFTTLKNTLFFNNEVKNNAVCHPGELHSNWDIQIFTVTVVHTPNAYNSLRLIEACKQQKLHSSQSYIVVEYNENYQSGYHSN